MKNIEEKLTKPSFEQISSIDKYEPPFPKESRLNPHYKNDKRN